MQYILRRYRAECVSKYLRTSARRIDILLQHVPFPLNARLSRIERPGERSQTPHRQFVRLYAYYYDYYIQLTGPPPSDW